jgi:hypothetical protein
MKTKQLPTCENCVYYDVVDDEGNCECVRVWDQDEVYQSNLESKNAPCRYFREYDEYKSVRLQN